VSTRQREHECLVREALASWPLRVARRLDGGWLELRLESPPGSDATPRELLRRNGDLPGGVRFALGAGAHGPRVDLRGEVPLDDPAAEVRRRIDAARVGFEAVLSGAEAEAASAVDASAPAVSDLQASLGEAGWACEARGDGSLAVDLGVPDLFLQAEIEPRPGAAQCATVLAVPEPVSAAAGEALALLLLRAGGAVRQVRPVLVPGSGMPRFEVVLSAQPSARELGHALAALATACRLFAREVEVVARSDRIASRVAAVLGGGRHPLFVAAGAGSRRGIGSTPNQSTEEEASWQRQQPQR
jgi:hypothetical protein